MLKDTIRTSAYRDFIYDHKGLFANKTVLDVGCGTGILSLFCARAGAAKVYAVDNAAIVSKTRAIVAANGLSETIECIAGKIEDVSLPVASVDVIVSEWMGYCLLFEAMLPSVLFARDKYLAKDGLMVPSHCTLHVAPYADAEGVADSVGFWDDVYGFDMRAMTDGIYDDVLVRLPEAKRVPGKSDAFLVLPLHEITPKELSFRKPFAVELDQAVGNLDGWVMWFDTFFLPSRNTVLPANVRAEDWEKSNRRGVAFTTGPAGKETHWRAGVMVVDRTKRSPQALPAGTKISGTVGFAEAGSNKRGLEIEVTWHVEGSNEHDQQIWFLH
jgi:type I protein arginine methyltransferase